MNITAATIATARKLADRNNGLNRHWHSAARAASPTGAVGDVERGFEYVPDSIPAELLALAEQIARLSAVANTPRHVGHDEAFVLWVDGRRSDARSTLPPYAGPRSSALSVAISLAAMLTPGAHRVELGSIVRPHDTGRVATVEVAA